MKTSLLSILLFSTILLHGQYYRERFGCKMGFPNVLGITNEYMIAKKVGLTTDFSCDNFIDRSWLFIYGDIGLRKYARRPGKGFYYTAGAGYMWSRKNMRVTRNSFIPRFGLGYHAMAGRFSLSPEIGGMVWDHQPTLYMTIDIGMAFNYK